MASRFLRALVVIAAAGVMVRIVYALAVLGHTDLGFDAEWYHRVANQLADGAGYAFDTTGSGRATAAFPPLYPLFLSLGSLLGASTEVAHQVISAVLGGATIVLTGFLGHRLGGERLGVAAAAVAAAYPTLVMADVSLMSEALYVPLALGAVLAAYALRDQPVTWRAVALGGLLGLGFLARGDAIHLAFVLVPVTILALPRTPLRERWQWAAIVAAAALVVASPWLVRNVLQFGTGNPLSINSGSVVGGANCESTWFGDFVGSWDLECLAVREANTVDLNEAELTAAWRREAFEFATDHAGAIPRVGAVRVLRLWGLYPDVDQARSEAREGRTVGGNQIGWVVHLLMLPLAVAGFVALRRTRVWLGPPLAVVAAVTLVALTAYGNQRFRVSAEPVLITFAAAGGWAMIDRRVRPADRARSEPALRAPTPRAPTEPPPT